MYDLVAAEHPMTVRQVFYRLVGMGLVAKTEGEYKSAVVRLLTELRLEGELPFSWIVDTTRWTRKPDTHDGLRDLLEDTASLYRRDLWRRQPVYVEVWCEKEALSGVIYGVTGHWDVPLMVSRGYASLSYLYRAAGAIRAKDKPAFIYFLGDFDPSGLDIAHQVEKRLSEFAPAAEITFERVAVTPAQIDEWILPTRPTKASDSRSGRFGAESVELDAIPPDALRQLVADCIERHMDEEEFARLKQVEENERLALDWFLDKAEDEGFLDELDGLGEEGE